MKVITIGRDINSNNIVVDDHKVSRIHLQMVLDDSGNYSVVDLNSTNGTFVNGQRITGEVPLKVTDELKIGDTVLPWQSYFDGQVSSGAKSSVEPQISVPQPSPFQKQKKSNSGSKLWLKYVIIGAVVLLLAGGGVVWKVYHFKQKRTELCKQLEEARKDSVKAVRNLAKAEEELRDAQEEYDKAIKGQDKEATRLAEANLKEKTQNLTKAQNVSNQANQNLNAVTSQLNQASQERPAPQERSASQERPVSQERKEQPKVVEVSENKPTKEEPKAVENTSKENNNSSELTSEMLKIRAPWNNKKAKAFCNDQHWWDCSEKTAKDKIVEEFSKLSNSDKKEMVETMKKFDKNTDNFGKPKTQKNDKAKKH